LFDRLGDALVVIGIVACPGADSQVCYHIDPGCPVFQPDAGHAQIELIIRMGKAGEVVGGGAGKVVTIVDVRRAGYGQSGEPVAGSGIRLGLGQTGENEDKEEWEKGVKFFHIENIVI